MVGVKLIEYGIQMCGIYEAYSILP